MLEAADVSASNVGEKMTIEQRGAMSEINVHIKEHRLLGTREANAKLLCGMGIGNFLLIDRISV
mgnify:FL=1|jgi:hypothetical protein